MPKRASIEFVACSESQGIKLKFGGEPFGLPQSLWPRSSGSGEPMQFICQIPIGPDLFPGVAEAVAYIFMTSSGIDGATWDPDAGENAVIIVPREKLTSSLTVGDAPRLCRMVKKWWSKRLMPKSCIYSAKLTMREDPSFIPDTKLRDMEKSEAKVYCTTLKGNKVGGTPLFLQNDELPIAEPWHLLLQLDSTQVPFQINFGDAGIGYAFINGSGTNGKFLWQCC